MPINITVRFGATNELTKEFAEGSTVATVVGNAGVKAALGYGDNTQALVDGSVVPGSTRLEDGDVVTIETRANSKA